MQRTPPVGSPQLARSPAHQPAAGAPAPQKPNWIMSRAALEDSPSRRDGVGFEEEKKKRRKTVWYMGECGRELRLPKIAIMTAQTFLNRFYALQSFKAYDRFVQKRLSNRRPRGVLFFFFLSFFRPDVRLPFEGAARLLGAEGFVSSPRRSRRPPAYS